MVPKAEAAACRTSTCSAAKSDATLARAGCAALPIDPNVCTAIIRIFGAGSSSKEQSAGTASALLEQLLEAGLAGGFARAYADARVVKIAGGSIEIMKTIIARDLFKNRIK